MKNLLTLLLAISFCPTVAFALKREHFYSKSEIYHLVKRIKAKRAAIKRQLRLSAIPLVRFYSSPAAPKAGEKITVFAQMDTSFTDQETVILATLDANALPLEHPASELWVADLGSFSELRSHELKTSVYIQNAEDAVQIRAAITQLESEITNLNEQIANATDPDIIAQLTAQRDDKVAQKNLLIQALSDLKSPVGEEIFNFFISENTASPDFPHIASVSPNVVKLNTAKEITIAGSNFGSSPSVTLGGQAVSISSSSATSIVGTVPGIATQGVKDLEVRFTAAGQIKNAFLKNAFFVTSEDTGNPPPPNYPPVSVATAASSLIEFGAVAIFNSTGSYDPEGGGLRYEWRLISKPTESSFVVPTNPHVDTPQFSISPDVAGYYVAELKVFEQSGAQLGSFPSLAIVQMSLPVNHAPSGSASPIQTFSGASATSQVSASDQDSGQTLSYSILTAPTGGNASVSSSGLVSYTANLGFSGADLVEVRVQDNGVPQLSTTVQVNIDVIANLAPVVPSPLVYAIRTRGVPFQLGMSLSSTATPSGGIVDPEGNLQSIVWDFGDGTQEKTFDATLGAILHNYVAAGNYTATLTATDVHGVSTSRQVSIAVVDTDIPTAKFTLTPSNGGGGAVPLAVAFDASAAADADGIVQYRWRWGNVSTEEVTSSSTINHTFTAAGVYPVRLRTRDANGAQGEAIVNVTVGSTVAGAPSQAQFAVGPPREVVLGNALSFDGARSFNPNVGGTLVAYNWNIGDFLTCPTSAGCTATGVTTSYIYPAVGNLFPSLQVQTSTGALSTRINQEVFIINSGHAPHAILRASALAGVAPLVVNFNGLESYDYDGSITGFDWNFGDSGTGSDASTSHTFSTPGVYITRLTAVDDDGNPHSVSQTITVTAALSTLKGKKRDGSVDPEREYQRQILAGACGLGDGEACANLAEMYAEDGDEFTSQKLKERACGLGFELVCI